MSAVLAAGLTAAVTGIGLALSGAVVAQIAQRREPGIPQASRLLYSAGAVLITLSLGLLDLWPLVPMGVLDAGAWAWSWRRERRTDRELRKLTEGAR
jgi:hypothetical protein